MTQVFIVKGNKLKPISAQLALDLMRDYTIAGTTYNSGQVIYLRSRNGKRIHSILIKL